MAKLDRELREYIESMTQDMGRPERRRAMSLYMTGLLLDGERKSIEPMAARLVEDARQIPAMRQRLQQCVVTSPWSDGEMFGRLARKLERDLPGIEALVVDDTGLPKKGTHSVGVQRQYSGTLGRTDNCQVATSLHLASERGSGCIGLRLYLPEVWTEDQKRRRSVDIPDDVEFLRKWEISLQQIDDALSWGVRKHVVLADAGYGDAVEFRDGLTARGLPYLVGVQGSHLVWPPGSHPHRPTRVPGVPGRPKTQYRDGDNKPLSIAALAAGLSRRAFRTVTWRQGSRGRQSSRFAFLRVHAAERYTKRRPPSDEQWLIIEWPRDEEKPTKHYRRRPHTASWCASRSCVGGSNATTRNSSKRSGSTISKVECGEAFTITRRSALSPTPSSRSDGRFPPRSRTQWTLPMVRRHLQRVLLCIVGVCPLCRQRTDDWTLPFEASRM